VPVVPRVIRPTTTPPFSLVRLMNMTHTLILLRHGNSIWNQKNLFTGWVDVRLSEQGVVEATRAGELLAQSGLKPDVLYTSVLTRAIQTAHRPRHRGSSLDSGEAFVATQMSVTTARFKD